MAETITLPGVGPVKKQTALLLGGAVILVGGIAWYRSRNAASSGPSSSSPAAGSGSADQSGTIDPATGYAYGSPEDQAALAAQANGNYGGYGGGYSGSSGSYPGSYTTNAQWAQAAEDYLVNTVGGEANTVGNAIGKYITGQPVTSDQVTVIEEAIAFAGYPPVNGPSGYPPSYRTASTPPSGGSGSGSTKLTAPTGVHATQVGKTVVALAWSRVSSAQSYVVYEHGFGSPVSESHGPTATVHNLRPGTSYSFTVHAVGSNGIPGPASSQIHVKTRK
jgi:hypothetical protein